MLQAKHQRAPRPLMKVGGISLYEEDRGILSSAEWLNHDFITACQNLLHQQYPTLGLQDPAFAQTFAMEPQAGEFVQIINTNGNHWIKMLTIGCSASSVSV